jgi:glycosyltransferase involved in cell wall biosynthesis
LKKIILIGPVHPLRGGIAKFNERLAKQLMDDGHEVIIYTFSLQYPKWLFPGKTQLSHSTAPEGLNIKVVINSIHPVNWWKVAAAIASEKPDLVIFRYWLPFMAPCLGTIARRIKSLTSGHPKKTTLLAIVDNALPHEKRPGDKLLTRYFTQSIDTFLVMSEHVKKDLEIFTKRPITLFPHPLYDNFGHQHNPVEARNHLKWPQNTYIFLFFGFIRHYKGLDLLLEAISLPILANQDFKLVIAGEFYSDEDKLREQMAHSPVRDKLILHTDFIPDEEVGYYFSASDCVVQPYRSATQSGVSPLAYHFEVPIVVTRVGGLPDLVPDGIGHVCEPQPESIAQSMLHMLKNFDTALFKTKISEEKKKLSWDTFTQVMWTSVK